MNLPTFSRGENQILLGTCGWSYVEWEGLLYPQEQSKLKQYSFIFPTTEIDSIFYRLPGRAWSWVGPLGRYASARNMDSGFYQTRMNCYRRYWNIPERQIELSIVLRMHTSPN